MLILLVQDLDIEGKAVSAVKGLAVFKRLVILVKIDNDDIKDWKIHIDIQQFASSRGQPIDLTSPGIFRTAITPLETTRFCKEKFILS